MVEEMPYPGKNVIITPEQQLSSGYTFFWVAERYKQSAQKCVYGLFDGSVRHDPIQEWANIHDQFCTLIGHATELYLKSFLLAGDLREEDLRGRPFGHNLINLLNRCRELKMEGIKEDTIELISRFNKYYGVQPYMFRYPSIDNRELFCLDEINSATDNIRSAVFPSVIRKARSLGQPVED